MTSKPQTTFIAIAGNIGAGKSTLTRLLAERLGWQPFYEANAENPYLADFYQDMHRWSFHSQVFFLGKRLEHHHKLLTLPGPVVQDRTVYEDAEVFAHNLYRQGYLSERDYDAYRRLYQSVAAFLPPPTLLIYLQASTETLLAHIQRRGRDYERDISPAYLAQLGQLYESWINRWTASPLLRLNIDGRDFEHQPAVLDQIVTQIHTMLNQHDALIRHTD